MGPSSKRRRTIDIDDDKEISDVEEIQSTTSNSTNIDVEEVPKKNKLKHHQNWQKLQNLKMR